MVSEIVGQKQGLMLTSFEHSTKPLMPLDLIFIGGMNPCGKTSLLEAMRLSAECVGPEYVFADFSKDIRPWHLDPVNRSPLREMALRHDQYINTGILIPDDEVNQLVMYFLHIKEREVLNEQRILEASGSKEVHAGIKKFVVSGWPRTLSQLELAEQIFRNIHFVKINVSDDTSEELRKLRIKRGGLRADDTPERYKDRVLAFKEKILPVYDHFATKNPKNVIPVDFHEDFLHKVKVVIHGTITCSKARKSMLAKVEPKNPDNHTKASRFIADIRRHAVKP